MYRYILILFSVVLIAVMPFAACASTLNDAIAADEAGDYEKALGLMRPLAENGEPEAQYRLGRMFINGHGIEKNEEVAVAWYRKATKQGHLTAQTNLAFCYLYGQGLNQDDSEAFKLLQNAAKQGGARAQNALGWMYANGRGVEKSADESVVWYRKAAEQGDMYAQYNLAERYLYGGVVKQSDSEAFAWYGKSAKQGYADAQNSFGWMYANGRGVKKGFDEAIVWYRKAADQEHADALGNLGLLFQFGRGVSEDYAEALTWHRRASEQGNQMSQRLIPLLEEMLSSRKRHPDSPKLFGVSLVGAHRDEVRVALGNAKLKVLRENYDYYADQYDPSGVMKSADNMYVFYSLVSDKNGWGSTDYLAKVQYRFPSSLDNQQVVGLRDMVASKYGNPDVLTGNPSVGKVSYTWKKDGVDILVARGWPDTTTYLTYIVPPINDSLKEELAALENEKKDKEYKQSVNAF